MSQRDIVGLLDISGRLAEERDSWEDPRQELMSVINPEGGRLPLSVMSSAILLLGQSHGSGRSRLRATEHYKTGQAEPYRTVPRTSIVRGTSKERWFFTGRARTNGDFSFTRQTLRPRIIPTTPRHDYTLVINDETVAGQEHPKPMVLLDADWMTLGGRKYEELYYGDDSSASEISRIAEVISSACLDLHRLWFGLGGPDLVEDSQ